MTSLKNIIQPIIFDFDKNIYAVGLCLKDGQIVKTKIYNKIFEHNDSCAEFLEKFGGQDCRNSYLNTKEWKNYYPGFSGFTIGVEIDNENIHTYGYGFKDRIEGNLVFKTYLLDFKGLNYESDTYKYINYDEAKIPEKKIKTDLIEIKISDNSCYCYCPKISFSNILEIEDSIKHSLDAANKVIFDFIKDLSVKFYILNYGVNTEYEKIYLISNNNKDINDIYYLLEQLEYFKQ